MNRDPMRTRMRKETALLPAAWMRRGEANLKKFEKSNETRHVHAFKMVDPSAIKLP